MVVVKTKKRGVALHKKICALFERSELKTGGWSAVVGLNGLDPDSTVGIGDFLAQAVGRRHSAVSRARKIHDSCMTKLITKVNSERVEDAYELTNLIFDNPQNSMYRSGDERISTILRALVAAQRKDGGWLTFYSGGKSDVPITVFLLRVLVSHSIINTSTLQNMFDVALKDKSP